jgi:hypothetical protein
MSVPQAPTLWSFTISALLVAELLVIKEKVDSKPWCGEIKGMLLC